MLSKTRLCYAPLLLAAALFEAGMLPASADAASVSVSGSPSVGGKDGARPGIVAVTDRRQVFNAPAISGYRLDICLRWGEACGKPAADAFCINNGFEEAETFSPAYDIGARSPTMVLATGQICDQQFCDGFQSITCRVSAGGGGGGGGGGGTTPAGPAMVFENCTVSPCVLGVADPGYAVPGNQRYAEGWRRFNTNPYPLMDFANHADAWRFACRIHFSSPRHSAPDIVRGRVDCAGLCGGNPRCP